MNQNSYRVGPNQSFRAVHLLQTITCWILTGSSSIRFTLSQHCISQCPLIKCKRAGIFPFVYLSCTRSLSVSCLYVYSSCEYKREPFYLECRCCSNRPGLPSWLWWQRELPPGLHKFRSYCHWTNTTQFFIYLPCPLSEFKNKVFGRHSLLAHLSFPPAYKAKVAQNRLKRRKGSSLLASLYAGSKTVND